MKNNNWIKEKLGVSAETLENYCSSAYLLQINPLPQLRRRFPDITFMFERGNSEHPEIEINPEIDEVIVRSLKK